MLKKRLFYIKELFFRHSEDLIKTGQTNVRPEGIRRDNGAQNFQNKTVPLEMHFPQVNSLFRVNAFRAVKIIVNWRGAADHVFPPPHTHIWLRKQVILIYFPTKDNHKNS